MSNSLYQDLGANKYSDLIGAISNFKNTISGDPKTLVTQMLNSGQMTQAEFNRLGAMASQIAPFIK